jgi:ADP-ribosylglycohydrolase
MSPTSDYIQSETFYKKVQGCLAGVAIGDAMGMPASSYLPEEIKERYGVIDRLLDAPKGHPYHDGFPKGHVTDDTELTMIVVDMLLVDGEPTPEGMAKRILEWAEENRLLESGVIGPSTRRAILALMDGKDPRETGRYGTTNGAPMKISPIGVINVGNRGKLLDDVEKVCLPSHGTSVAISSAAAVAGAVAEALQAQSSVDVVIREAVLCGELGAQRGRPIACPSIPKKIQLAIQLIEKEKDPLKQARILYDYIGTDVSCVSSIPTVFGVFYSSQGDPMKSVITASNLGGDTDTIASMVGGISGAFKGIDAFPVDVVKTVEDENHLNFSDIACKLIEYMVR